MAYLELLCGQVVEAQWTCRNWKWEDYKYQCQIHKKSAGTHSWLRMGGSLGPEMIREMGDEGSELGDGRRWDESQREGRGLGGSEWETELPGPLLIAEAWGTLLRWEILCRIRAPLAAAVELRLPPGGAEHARSGYPAVVMLFLLILNMSSRVG